jgi:hypothetical protein
MFTTLRKIACSTLVLVITATLFTSQSVKAATIATPSTTSFVMDKAPVTVSEAYDVGGSNYCQLRAIAALLNGTASQFDVTWDGTYAHIETGKPYTGTKTAAKLSATDNVLQSDTKFMIDKNLIALEKAYLIDGDTNYLQLREIAEKLSETKSRFNIYWDDVLKLAVIETGKAYTGVKGTGSNWVKGYDWRGNAAFSYTLYGYLTIECVDGNAAWYEQKINVEKNTIYRLSADIKVENFSHEDEKPGGATVGVDIDEYSVDYITSNTWEKSAIQFNSGDHTEVTLRLKMGNHSAIVKGKAYFSDIVLERSDKTPEDNHWNILTLIYRNVSTNTYNRSFSDKEVKEFTDAMENLPYALENLSAGRMVVDKIDTFIINEPVKTVGGTNGAFIPEKDIDIDKYLAGNDYSQIIVIAPLSGAETGEWAGLGGGHYKNIWYIIVCASSYQDKQFTVNGKTYDGKVCIFVHEMLHCVDSNAAQRGFSGYLDLHDNASGGFYDDHVGWLDWYAAKMQNVGIDGKGLPKEAFFVNHWDFSASTIIDLSIA